VSHEKWSFDEDELVLRLVDEIGPGSWAEIARHLPKRTDAAVSTQLFQTFYNVLFFF
jgi:hypothetical protein